MTAGAVSVALCVVAFLFGWIVRREYALWRSTNRRVGEIDLTRKRVGL